MKRRALTNIHPLLAWCDNSGELLAVICRPGNAGSNTAADHIAIIDAAIAAIPAKWRCNLLITIDGAGCSHAVVDQKRIGEHRFVDIAPLNVRTPAA